MFYQILDFHAECQAGKLFANDQPDDQLLTVDREIREQTKKIFFLGCSFILLHHV